MIKYIVLLFVSTLIVACESSEELDTQKPEINILTPTEHQEIELGQTIEFVAHVSDNVALASYKLEIHRADDGHQHRSESVPWHFEIVENLSGNTAEITHQIPVADTVLEGHYHIGLFVIDQSGNQNQQFVEVYVGEEDHQH